MLTATEEEGSGRWSLLTRGTKTSSQASLPRAKQTGGQEPGLLDLLPLPKVTKGRSLQKRSTQHSYLRGSSQSLNCCTVRESGGLAKIGRKTSSMSKLKNTERHHPRPHLPRREQIPTTSVALGYNWVFPSPPPTWLLAISLSPNPLLKDYFKYKPEGMPQTSSCQVLCSVQHADKNERLAFWKT